MSGLWRFFWAQEKNKFGIFACPYFWNDNAERQTAVSENYVIWNTILALYPLHSQIVSHCRKLYDVQPREQIQKPFRFHTEPD